MPAPTPADRSTPPSPGTAPPPLEGAARDEAAVREAVLLVARGADLRQWPLVRALFADTVDLDYGTPERLSPDAVVGRWRALFAQLDATEHGVREVRVTLDGDRARARSAFRAEHRMRGAAGGDTWVLEGRYEHALARTPDGWRITGMRMLPGAQSGNTGLIAQAQQRAAAATGAGGAEGGARAASGATAGASSGAASARERNRATVRAFFATLEALGSGEQVAALFAEDGRQVMPFAPEGFPKRLDGRAAIARQYGGLPAAYASMRFPGLVVRDLADPDEFLATYRGDIALKAGGKYDNVYAGHFVVRDGRIVEFTEYFDPIVLQRAFGGRLEGTFSVPR
jgi:ketosteroid isomerase-like protein